MFNRSLSRSYPKKNSGRSSVFGQRLCIEIRWVLAATLLGTALLSSRTPTDPENASVHQPPGSVCHHQKHRSALRLHTAVARSDSGQEGLMKHHEPFGCQQHSEGQTHHSRSVRNFSQWPSPVKSGKAKSLQSTARQ